MQKPLNNITVVDLTHVLAGPYCSMILSDLGARVIKVERPGIGDDTRAFPPFKDGESAYFSAINHGKESIALNLKDEADRAVLDRLLAKADMVLENYRPGVMEKLGFGWEAIHEAHPHLIYGAVSGFGHTGPDSQKPSYDMVVQALGGVMSITGEAGREPVRAGASIGDIVAGLFLANGVLAALYQRQTTGLGSKVDISMLDCQLAILEHGVAITSVTGKPPKPSGARHPTITPFESFHAHDGLIVIAAGNDALFAKMCHALNLADLINDPRFKTNTDRVENTRVLKRLMELELLEQDCAYWLDRLETAGVPCAPIQNIAQTMEHRQIQARNMVVDIAAEGARPAFVAAGNPIKMSGLEDPRQRGAAPLLDEDRAAILEWLRS